MERITVDTDPSGLNFLRTLLGLTSTSHPLNFRPPIFISIPQIPFKTKSRVDLPLSISILDLLDLSFISAEKLISTHIFTTKLPLCWTKPPSDLEPGELRTIAVLVTKALFSLEQLLPAHRELLFISTGVQRDQRSLSLLLRSMGLTKETKVLGIIDIDMLAEDIVSLGFSSSVSEILQRLQTPAEKGCEGTEFVMRSMLLIVLESCKNEVRDDVGRAWVEFLRTVGTGMLVLEGPMDVVRKGAKKVGEAILGKVRRSKEEIEKIRAERKKRKDRGPIEEYVTEMRLWDGMWELL